MVSEVSAKRDNGSRSNKTEVENHISRLQIAEKRIAAESEGMRQLGAETARFADELAFMQDGELHAVLVRAAELHKALEQGFSNLEDKVRQELKQAERDLEEKEDSGTGHRSAPANARRSQ